MSVGVHFPGIRGRALPLMVAVIGLSSCTSGSLSQLESTVAYLNESSTSTLESVSSDGFADAGVTEIESATEIAATQKGDETVEAIQASDTPADSSSAVAETSGTESGATGQARDEALSESDGSEQIAATTAETTPNDAYLNETPKKRGFLAAFWSAKPRTRIPVDKPAPPSTADTDEAALAHSEPAQTETAARVARASYANDVLPGVRGDELFEIERKSGLDDDSDVDINETDTYQLASAAGLARLAPNGLLKQRDSVDVACLKPSLVRVLKTVERRYGKHVVVTSGYRSPAHNRRARGARNSLHMYCAAADIQVEGISKWDLAKFLRSMPGRGGVGTYCHTNSVHVDVGPERDWNWRCRRRKST